ncbi:cupin domain-containing protein [Roseobacter sp. HKCCA0434]|uniref:cupin domain-containing protein n=1 Tax=Roseobacter sp. HKCCA0434 TaxID=3079297 RepID=UPI002905F284|nr:cupin domain-containing protein [Roseobacter sp. HKCCA0434]
MTQDPRTYNVLNILMKFHAFPEDVDGKYCLVECVVPVGAGAPPNRHAGETEGFFVLEGQVAFHVDGEDRITGPGEFVSIPDGAIHAFQAIGEGPARLLILNAPGHMHKAFFTRIGTPLPEGQTTLPEPSEPDLPTVMQVAQEVGMSIPAPR